MMNRMFWRVSSLWRGLMGHPYQAAIDQLKNGEWQHVDLPAWAISGINQTLKKRGYQIIVSRDMRKLCRYEDPQEKVERMVREVFEIDRSSVQDSSQYKAWKAAWEPLRKPKATPEQLEESRKRYSEIVGREVSLAEFQAQLPKESA